MAIIVFRFLSLAISVCQGVLFAYAILSWLPALERTWLGRLVNFLAEPLFAPLKGFRLIIGPLDFTVFMLMWLLQVLDQLLFRVLVG